MGFSIKECKRCGKVELHSSYKRACIHCRNEKGHELADKLYEIDQRIQKEVKGNVSD